MGNTIRIIISLITGYIHIKRTKDRMFFKNNTINSVYSGLRIRHNFNALPSTNSILLVNYPAERFGYLAQGLIPRDVCIISSIRAKSFLELIYPDDRMILLKDEKNRYEKTKQMIADKIKRYSIFSYINDNSTRHGKYHLGNLRKGMFYIAKELQIPITPIAFGYLEPVLGSLPSYTYYIKVGPTTYVNDVQKSMKTVHGFLQKNIIRFRKLRF